MVDMLIAFPVSGMHDLLRDLLNVSRKVIFQIYTLRPITIFLRAISFLIDFYHFDHEGLLVSLLTQCVGEGVDIVVTYFSAKLHFIKGTWSE